MAFWFPAFPFFIDRGQLSSCLLTEGGSPRTSVDRNCFFDNPAVLSKYFRQPEKKRHLWQSCSFERFLSNGCCVYSPALWFSTDVFLKEGLSTRPVMALVKAPRTSPKLQKYGPFWGREARFCRKTPFLNDFWLKMGMWGTIFVPLILVEKNAIKLGMLW